MEDIDENLSKHIKKVFESPNQYPEHLREVGNGTPIHHIYFGAGVALSAPYYMDYQWVIDCAPVENSEAYRQIASCKYVEKLSDARGETNG